MVAKRRGKKQKEEEDVDYAATADAFFGAEASDEEAEADQNEKEKGSDDDSDGDDGSESEESESEEEEEEVTLPAPTSTSGEQCSFDLRNLLAMNSHQIDTSELYSRRSKKEKEEHITIPPEKMGSVVNEQFLLDKATDGCAQLIEALWQLPTERSDAGPMVTLPSFDASSVPRALPPPPPKKETKWEKFARERGLPLNKNKRSRKVFDEATGEWMYRHGYQKANSESKEWPIMEVKGNADPYADPWEKQREEKRARKDKNVESRMRNEERAGNLSKGTTTRVLKSKDRTRQAGKEGGNRDRDSLPTGVPVDLRPTKSDSDLKPAKRGKSSTMAALVATQRSTASLGKFDKMLEGEPERKKIVAGAKKRRFESNTDKKVVSSESERSMKLFNTVMNGGGVEKEKARRKGRLAKGETAYDYDFDDGLGASTFRKKKGRAGAGKMKKMTKKRVK